MRTKKSKAIQLAAYSLLSLLTLLLGTVACNMERTLQPISSPTGNLSPKENSTEILTATPVQPAVTMIPPTETTTPLRPLNSSGGVIAFQSDRDRQDDIYIMNADGSDQRLLISNKWALDGTPAWSPDGKQIAFVSRDRGKDFEICVVGISADLQVIDSKAVKYLTDNEFDDLHPTWSADGKYIAFVSKRDSHSNIFVINIEGGDERQLTDNGVDDKDPVWSPDGKQIAFVSRRDGSNNIYVMKSDGSDLRRLTSNQSNEWSPTWSPDGAQIAFISDRNGEHALYAISVDGAGIQRLTDNNYPWNDDPAWSPDGTQIAFRSNRNGNIDIYVMNVNESSIPQQLTYNGEIDQDRSPAWWPIP